MEKENCPPAIAQVQETEILMSYSVSTIETRGFETTPGLPASSPALKSEDATPGTDRNSRVKQFFKQD